MRDCLSDVTFHVDQEYVLTTHPMLRTAWGYVASCSFGYLQTIESLNTRLSNHLCCREPLKTRLSVLLLCACISVSSLPTVDAGYSGYARLSLEVSRIELQSPVPYVELRYLSFNAEVINLYQPFNWLWLGSTPASVIQGDSINRTIEVENRTEVIGQRADVYLEYFAEKRAQSPRFEMVQTDEFSYAMRFLFATSANLTFQPEIHLTMYNRELEDEWRHDETWERLDGPPTNATLSSWGLSFMIFSNMHRIYDYQTFYLYEITFSKPTPYVERMSRTFTIPAFLLLLVLLSSSFLLIFGKLDLQAALTLYLGTAFFSLPFLVNYVQFGLGPVSFTEELFYADIYCSMGLAFMSLYLRWKGKKDDESVFEWRKRTRLKVEHSPELQGRIPANPAPEIAAVPSVPTAPKMRKAAKRRPSGRRKAAKQTRKPRRRGT